MTELEILKDIYFLVSLLCSVVVIWLCLKTIWSFFEAKKKLKEAAHEKKNKIYESLFESNRIEELIDYCESELKSNPNSRLALFYMVKASYFRGEKHRLCDYLERLNKVDPGSMEGYAKPFWVAVEKSE